MIEVTTQGMRENAIVLTAHGKVDHADYEKVIVPVIEEKIRAWGKIRVLYQLGENFSGYSVEALWDDAKLGVRHLTAFEKVAVVTNVAWIKDTVAFFRFLIPCPVRLFRNEELHGATVWINE